MRWLILTSSTGTGHNMRAESLRQWAADLYGDAVEVRIHHVLEATHPIYKFGVGFYNLIQRTLPRLHHLYFNYLEIAGMHRHGRRILGADTFKTLVRDWRPDRVISVHAHTNHGFFQLVREALPDHPVKCATYCGELFGGYGFSRHWANPAADAFIGATGEICASALAVGTPAERVHPGGFLLRSAFYAPPEQAAREAADIARELELDPQVFTLLLSTGQAGANNHLAILKKLAATGRRLQVVVLCARNAALKHRVERFAAAHPRLVIRALGHTERMLALKRLASLVVARPGTGATSELIQLGTPFIHNGLGGVMPQELITVQYCRHHGCGLLAKSADDIVRHTLRLMDHPAEADELRARLHAARPAGHPREICRILHDLA